jgi:hypothetical protein
MELAMTSLNGYIILLVCFIGLLFAKELNEDAIQRRNQDRYEQKQKQLAKSNEKARLEAIELAKCKVRVPHDGDPSTNTAQVKLTALASDDDDEASSIKFVWTQTSGKRINLKPNNSSSKVNFTATPGEYSFQVKASDKYDNSTETITVKILPERNEAPELELQCPI